MLREKKERFSVLVYHTRGLADLEIPARTFREAELIAKHHIAHLPFGVHIKQNAGFRHERPVRWTWSPKELKWMPIAWYDETADGKKVPKGSEGLFAAH